MVRFRNQDVGPIAVDIGGRTVRVLQLRRRREGKNYRCQVLCAAHREVGIGEVNQPDALREALRDAIRECKLHRRTAVTCLPPADVSVKSIRLPDMPEVELEAAALLEARERFSNLGDDAVLRAMPVGLVGTEGDPRQEVMILAAQPQAIDSRLNLLTDVGFEVAGIEPASSAFFRPIQRFQQRASDVGVPNAMVEVGYRGAQIILSRGSEIVFVKQCEAGGRQIDDAVARAAKVSIEEAAAMRCRDWATDHQALWSPDVTEAAGEVVRKLARELNLSLRYFAVTFRGQKPAEVLCGGREAGPVLARLMSAELDIPVSLADPLRGIDDGGFFSDDRRGNEKPAWTRVIGLALRTPLRAGARKVA